MNTKSVANFRCAVFAEVMVFDFVTGYFRMRFDLFS